MLPSRSVERARASGETVSRSTASPTAADWLPRGSIDVFGANVAESARELMTLPAEAVDRAFQLTLPVLGHGLRADRVVYCEAQTESGPVEVSAPPRFRGLSEWTPGGRVGKVSADVCSFSLDGCGVSPARCGVSPDCCGVSLDGSGVIGARLVCGQAQLVTPLARRSASASLPAWPAGPARLFVPCPGPEGLVGLLVIERRRSTGDWSAAQIARAEELGRSFGAFFERRRLSARVARLTAVRCRDERMELLGRMASSVTHDFNNLLTAILGYTDLLEMELEDGKPGTPELAEIRVAADRAVELVGEVLQFGREQTEGARPVVLEELLVGWEGLVRRVLGGDHTLALSFGDADRAAASIRIDPGRLERVILNLVANARDAIERRTDGGRLSIETRRVSIGADHLDPLDDSAEGRAVEGLQGGEYVRLTVRDDGCGIPPELHRRIFEPFFTDRDGAAGTGLGLALTAEVVRESGGGIRVESAPGEGAAFHLYFPVEALPA